MLDEAWLVALTSLENSNSDFVGSYDFSKESSSSLPKFDYDVAFELGNVARRLAREAFPGKGVVIDVSQSNGHDLFRTVTASGSSLDNDFWIARKRTTALRFSCSSYFMGLKLRDSGEPAEQRFFVDTKDYAFVGGAVPIFVDSAEFPVGCLIVSGLKAHEDHWLAVQSINEYLATVAGKK